MKKTFGSNSEKQLLFVDGLAALLVGNFKNIYNAVIFLECEPEVILKRQLERAKKDVFIAKRFNDVFDLRQEQFRRFIKPLKKECDLIIKI